MHALWENLVTSGFKNEKDPQFMLQVRTANSLVLLALLFFLTYIPIDFLVSKDAWVGFSHIIGLAMLGTGMMQMRLTRNIALTQHMIAAAGIFVLIPWLFTGGPFGAGIWWSTAYIIGMFFVLGRVKAMRWTLFYFCACGIVVLFDALGILKIHTQPLVLASVFFLSSIIASFMHFYEQNREFYEKLSAEKTAQLVASNERLLESEQATTAANAELEKNNLALKAKTAELAKLNSFMIDRELKMVELKKQIEVLEKSVERGA